MWRHPGLVLLACVLALVGAGFAVHAAMRPAADERSAAAWHDLGVAPLSARTGAVVVELDHRLLVFGGERHRLCPGDAQCPYPGDARDGATFDLRSGRWTRMAAPLPVQPRPWAVEGDTLLLLTERGGVVAYDARTDAWRTYPPPPVPLLMNDVLAADAGHAYVADDAAPGTGPLHRVESLDLGSGRWRLLPVSTDRPRMQLRTLLATPSGPVMTGLDPASSDAPVQVEILRHGRWHRYAAPSLHARFYAFSLVGGRVVAAFPPGGGSGQMLDLATGRWAPLASQPDAYRGDDAWSGAAATSGTRILEDGSVFDIVRGHSWRLTAPGDRAGLSAGLVGRGVYVLDDRSRLWWQRL